MVSDTPRPSSLSADPALWDDRLRSARGHLLQSWRWGEFKARHGWQIHRHAVSGVDQQVAQAQILSRRRGPFGIGYIPRGPSFGDGGPDAVKSLFAEIDAKSRADRILFMIVEPDRPLPLTGRFKQEGFVRGGEHIQPGRTVKIPLVPDEALLGQMRQNTRYSVRLAQRRGVQIVRIGDGATIDDFYSLLMDTAERNSFGVHSKAYYADFLATFGEDALCLFAYAEGQLAASLIAARFGEEAIYMYGASSTQNRAHGAAFLLQFEAMRWARESGCVRYDLWGIPMVDPNAVHEDGTRFAGTKSEDWRGLFRFKTGFGGEIVSYPPTLERRYRPVAAFLAKQLANAGRGL